MGGIIGYLIIWTIIYLYKKFRNIEGMGLGDAKLLSAIGFWFGWISLPFIIFISSLVALLVVAPSLVNKSKKCHQKFLSVLISLLDVCFLFLFLIK